MHSRLYAYSLIFVHCLLICLLLAVTFTFMHTHTHDESDSTCVICTLIASYQNILRSLIAIIIATALGVLCLAGSHAKSFYTCLGFHSATPVCLKVRLNA